MLHNTSLAMHITVSFDGLWVNIISKLKTVGNDIYIYIPYFPIYHQNRLHSSRHLILQILKIQQPFSANFVRKELLLKTNEVLFAKNIQFLIRYLQICDSLLNHFPQQFLFKKARKWVSFMYNTSVVEVHQYLWVSWIDINRAVCFRRKELQSTSIIIHRKENTFRSCSLYQLVRYTFKIGPSIHVLLNVILIMRIKPDFWLINITFFKLRTWSNAKYDT